MAIDRSHDTLAHRRAGGVKTTGSLEPTPGRCQAQLASFKTPRAFVRVDSLPRTALGKVQKHLLPEWKP